MAQSTSTGPGGASPGDLIDDHVKRNYAELYRQGREWADMAREARRMGDARLGDWLDSQAEGDKSDRGNSPVPVKRTSPGKAGQQNG